MSTKYDGQQTPIAVSAVDGVLSMGTRPACAGPWVATGALPPELRGIGQFWMSVDGSDDATLYQSLADLAASRSALEPASWALTKTFASLTATDADIVTATTADEIDTLEEFEVVASTDTPITIEAVTNAANTLTITAHGYSVDDGPFYVATDGVLPDGLSATTDYWIESVPTADTFTLSATKGGGVAALADDGTGNHTLVPLGVDIALDALVIPAHGLSTGDGPFQIATGTTLPTGMTAVTNYWVNAVAADRIALATSKARAIDGTVIDITGIGAGNQTLSWLNTDITIEGFRSPAHGFESGDGPYRIATDGALPTGLTADTNYWTVAIDADHYGLASSLANAIAETPANLTAAGSGTQTLSLMGTDTSRDTLLSEAHGFSTGDGPIRMTTSGALPTGLSTGTDYYAIRDSADKFQLATSKANALAGTEIDLSGIGSGTHTATLSSVDGVTEGVLIASHGMETGDGPVQVSTDGTLPTGLSAVTDYWIIKLDADHVAFAESLADAQAGTRVNITAIGSGTQTLERDLNFQIDLSAAGILEFLAQGIRPITLAAGTDSDADEIFVKPPVAA